ncbi:unnamed protein product [Aphanomyces euteiches]
MGDPTPTKRRKFTDDEDIMLLRQVNAERAFEARQGEITKAYGEKLQILDELLSAVDDAKSDERDRLVQTALDSQRNELEGSIIREEALSTLGK